MPQDTTPTVSPDVARELLALLGQVPLSVNDAQFDEKVDLMRRAKGELEAFLPSEPDEAGS